MATFTGPRGYSSIPPVDLNVGFATFGIPGWIDIAANPTANDVYQLCYVPAGFVVTGGMMYVADLDTGTETLDMDLGWAANGGSGTYDAIDADGLGNFGVLTGDAFANPSISPTAGNVIPFAGILSTGIFPFFTKKTLIQATCVATAATFAAGRLSVEVRGYVNPSLVVG
jgi:hypothetical protein